MSKVLAILFPKINQFTCDKIFVIFDVSDGYISLKAVQIYFYIQTKICILKTQQIWKVNYFEDRSQKISVPILPCSVGPMLSSAF